MRGEPQFRYEELAEAITGLVENGTLAPGARAPSLREISRQRRIGLSTALQAYRLLEDRGRPRGEAAIGLLCGAA
jgi:DNA-binding transcriptional MocR family regulator